MKKKGGVFMLTGKLDLSKLGDRLRKVDHFLIDVLSTRLADGGLSDYVAENKRKSSFDGVFNKRRQEVEEERINNMKRWAMESGIDLNFAASLMYQIISESCRIQDEIMIKKYREKQGVINEENEEDLYAYQRQNLIMLAAKVAAVYDKEYVKGFWGTKVYNEYEKEILRKAISGLPDKKLAIDLGCATGIMSFEMAPLFDRVVGYDISPEMIAAAKGKISNEFSHVEFVNIDIEDGINIPDNSVSLAVMNMGAASDIRNLKGILKELRNALRPDGKFFFSFYNSESLLTQLGFLPWPMPLAAHIDFDKRCLEVHYNSEVFFLYARARSVEEVKNLFSDFEIDGIYTFPTLASILPDVILEDEDKEGNCQENSKAKKLIKKIDTVLAASNLYSGIYIIVTGGRIV